MMGFLQGTLNMGKGDSAIERSLRRLTSRKNRYIIPGVLIGLFFLYLIRGCHLTSFDEAHYRIGQSNSWNTLNLMGKEKNFAAFNNALLASIGKQEQILIRAVVTDNPLADLQSGNLQGILTTLEENYSNINFLVFSDTYFSTGPVLLIPAKVPVDGWNEMRKKIIGISIETPHLLNLEENPSIEVKLYQDILVALADLSQRKIDGAIFPLIPAVTYTETFYKDEIKIATLPLTSEGVRLAAKKNKQGEELIKQFNQGLAKLKEEGSFDELLNRWGFINPEKVVEP